MALIDKLNEFKTSLDDCKTALKNKGVSVSKCTADVVASNIDSIATTKSMGSKSVTFKQNAIVYGVSITENESDPEKRVTYIENAKGMVPVSLDFTKTGDANYNQWKSSWILDHFKPVALKTNGTVDFEIDPNNQYYKKGTTQTTGMGIDYDGNAMVQVDKFYVKYSMNGSNEEIRISDKKLEGYEAIGFIRENGSEADKIFLPMYMGSISNGKLRSLITKMTFDESYEYYKRYAKANGNGYEIETWAMNQLIGAVYLILMKNCDVKAALGEGRHRGDNHSYPLWTGVLAQTGAIAYNSSDNTHKFMYIEDFANNFRSFNSILRLEVGSFFKDAKLYVKMRPPYSDTYDVSGYTEVTDYANTTNTNRTNIIAMKCSNKYGRVPVLYNDTGSKTYEASQWVAPIDYYTNYSNRGIDSGIFGRNYSGDYSNSTPWYGAALTYLPPK